MDKYVCIHGHFYQPPRENPWLEEVELEDSASPYHDWNERITAECYAPNAFSRILSTNKEIGDIVNNYANISFNFGPTLLSWLEQKQPSVYRKILEADAWSKTQFSGHGSAIAQVYNHIIMPLANARDKRTQVIWGIRDFEHRFQRKPEGFWLSETAVDTETLEILAEQGIKFTILSPRQARRTKKLTSTKWHDVSGGKIDPRMPYLCRLPSGKNIAIFFYDAYIAQDVAFGPIMKNGEVLAHRLCGTFSNARRHSPLAHIAMDGETFGHHSFLGDMTLAYCLDYVQKNRLANITIYGEYLEKYPPTYEVEIWENSSWSCIHGIERWRSNCGCNSGKHAEWNQEWRAPLRGALDWLRDTLANIYEEKGKQYLQDIEKARNEYVDVILDRSPENVEVFLSRYKNHELSREEKTKVLSLLEMQRCSLLMYTSCGWFFDEISGIETVQILRYSARAIQIAHDVANISLEEAFVTLLSYASSNIDNFGNGRGVYETLVKPSIVNILRAGAHYALSSLFENYSASKSIRLYKYTITQERFEKLDSGKQQFAVGHMLIRSDVTWEESCVSFAVLHFGERNLNGGVRIYRGEKAFAAMSFEIKEAFLRNDIPQVLRLMDENFETHNYSFWHLFRDEQRKVLNLVFGDIIQGIESSFRQIYTQYSPVIQTFRNMQVPLPKPLASTTEFILNLELKNLLQAENLDSARIAGVVSELGEKSLIIDRQLLEFISAQKINALMEKFANEPGNIKILENIEEFLSIARSLNLHLNLWKAQNIYFSIEKNRNGKIRGAIQADEIFPKWLSHFKTLGNRLGMKTS